MKPAQKPTTADHPKSQHSKSSKKSSKSRAKAAKLEAAHSHVAAMRSGAPLSAAHAVSGSANSNEHVFMAPAPPGLSAYLPNSVLEETLPGSDAFSSKNPHMKCFVGLEPRSIKVIWEQHDQSDIELSREVCARVAEDASYKLWELISNVKTYARHSGGAVTYDLVNEVLRDSDVPPMLGAMDSEWDRIDYDGSFFFFSDKIVELREEYQKDVTIKMPDGQDLTATCPIAEISLELMKKYIPSLVYIIFNADAKTLNTALNEAAFSIALPSCYRILLEKIIYALAFKQCDAVSERCWRFLRACSVNPMVPFENCRAEHMHLTEILICQLLGPYELIVVSAQKPQQPTDQQQQQPGGADSIMKMDVDEENIATQTGVKEEFAHQPLPQEAATFQEPQTTQDDKVYKLLADDDDDDDASHLAASSNLAGLPEKQARANLSPFFACPVDMAYVNDLCSTIGHMAAANGFFQTECTFHIVRRLERFFEGRDIQNELECQFISRAIRGLIALGEYAFREFIPFAYKFQVDVLPERMWNDFALGATFLKGPDDIYLYEWLEYLCGADKLQPYLVYSARYHDKLLTNRFLRRKPSTYRILPKVGVRRLEWSLLAAAMCHGDDPNRALKPKPTIHEVFPELVKPNRRRYEPGTIRFKFSGCRPSPLIPKREPPDAPLRSKSEVKPELGGDEVPAAAGAGIGQHDILIARRKLYKPLTNERRIVPLSSYCFTTI